jgi:hypothetical protein
MKALCIAFYQSYLLYFGNELCCNLICRLFKALNNNLEQHIKRRNLDIRECIYLFILYANPIEMFVGCGAQKILHC